MTQTIDIAPISKHSLTHEEAWLYCLTLSHNGHKDWRLPTYDEWNSNKEVYGYLFSEPFPDSTFLRMHTAKFQMQQVPVRSIK